MIEWRQRKKQSEFNDLVMMQNSRMNILHAQLNLSYKFRAQFNEARNSDIETAIYSENIEKRIRVTLNKLISRSMNRINRSLTLQYN
jgi:hypothetical protein